MTPTYDDVAAAIQIEPHPLVWPHTSEEADEWHEVLRRASGEAQAEMVKAAITRAKRLKQAAADPLFHGIEPDLWKTWESDLSAEGVEFQICLGANRSTKSYRAAQRLVEAAMTYPDGFHCVLGETEQSSKHIQQPLLWQFLQPHVGHLNWKTRHSLHQKIRYTPTDGFTDGVLMLPNGTRIVIDTYGSDHGKWEGIEWGAKLRTPLKCRPDGTAIQNLAWWADESLTLPWLEMLVRRSRFRKAKGIWSFTPLNGITPALKEVQTLMKVLDSSPATLLPSADADGCPPGSMPTRAETTFERAKASVVWIHIEDNPLAEHKATVLANLKGATTEIIERLAYGYARDIIGRQFTLRSYHLIDYEDLPEIGTDYQVIDYHPNRPCFAIYIRASPGLEPENPYYDIWADWPDRAHFGEWAITSHRALTSDSHKGWDGERGPAQNPLNYGYADFKAAWFELERVHPDGSEERDPKRRALQIKAKEEGRPLLMQIEDRIIDSRAGPTKSLEDHGQTCPMEKFEEEHTDPLTGKKMPDFRLVPADGRRHDCNMVRELMAVSTDESGRVIGRPRLRIVRNCEQVIWALANFTGAGGEEGACKDPIDCIEYAARGDLRHITEGMIKVWGPRE